MRILVIRLGAYGDMLMITPVIKKLKEQGHYIILNTNTRGKEVFENNPNVDEYIMHDENMPIDELSDHWEKLKTETKADKVINFSESIECNIALHPVDPTYNLTKEERFDLCNKNYYEVTEQWADLTGCQKLPELYFTQEEKNIAKSHLNLGIYYYKNRDLRNSSFHLNRALNACENPEEKREIQQMIEEIQKKLKMQRRQQGMG